MGIGIAAGRRSAAGSSTARPEHRALDPRRPRGSPPPCSWPRRPSSRRHAPTCGPRAGPRHRLAARRVRPLGGRRHLDRDAVEHGVAGERRRRSGSSASRLRVHARVRARRPPSRTPSTSWPQPCGIETTPGMMRVGHLDRHLDLAGARAHAGARAVGEAEPLRVVRVHVRGAAVRALHERREVVHPRVVGAQLAAADQHHLAVAVRAQRGAQPRHVGDDRLRARARPCRSACAARSGRRGCSGPRSMPCGAASRSASVRSYGPGAQQQVEQPLGAAARLAGASATSTPGRGARPRPRRSRRTRRCRRRRPGRRRRRVSRSSVSHSCGIVGRRAAGGDQLATLRTASW